jgi:pilus assembly protein Flp/PilA
MDSLDHLINNQGKQGDLNLTRFLALSGWRCSMNDLLLKIWCSAITRIDQMKESERGATAVEYGIMVALIAAVIITVVRVVGGKTSNSFETVNGALP